MKNIRQILPKKRRKLAKVRKLSQIINNILCKDFFSCEIEHYFDAKNIQIVRAQVSEDVIPDFIENISSESANVPTKTSTIMTTSTKVIIPERG